MLSLEAIQKLLQDRSISAVAKAAGLHVNTVAALRLKDSNPKHATLKVVSDYFEAQLEHYQK